MFGPKRMDGGKCNAQGAWENLARSGLDCAGDDPQSPRGAGPFEHGADANTDVTNGARSPTICQFEARRSFPRPIPLWLDERPEALGPLSSSWVISFGLGA